MKQVSIVMVLMISIIAVSCGSLKEGNPIKQTIEIQTNAQCGDCKARIEGDLNFMKGVIFAELDLGTKIVLVKYNSKKTSPEEIRKRIAGIGYSADEVEADKTAQSNLPACCQPGGHE